MNLDKRVYSLEQRAGPTESVDTIILVGIAPAVEPGGEPTEAGRAVLWTRAEELSRLEIGDDR